MGLFRYVTAFTAIILATIGVLLYRRRRYAHTPSTHLTHSTQNSPPSEDCPRGHVNSHSLLNAYKVTVVRTIEECEQFLQNSIPGPVRVVGLDCEWRGPGYLSRKQHSNDDYESEESESKDCPVALLQLAFPNGEVVLVRLCQMKGIGRSLRDLLTNRSVLKFGVGISNDVSRLAAAIGVITAGCVDLQHIAVRCGIRSGTSLQGLCHQMLGLAMDKTFHLRCGDWEAKQLSQDQVDYGALDAIIALHILQAFVELKISKHDRRESSRNNHTSHDQPTAAILIGQSLETWLNNESHHACLLSLCQGVIDVKFKQKLSKTTKNLDNGAAPVVKRTSAYSVRQSSLYHNCRLLAPDGQLLSTMHRRKLEWYLERGLGTLVCESPMTVQLHFEPAGRPGADREYYLREKENICAVCGTNQNCVRKNIIPHEYRRHFPPLMKEHLSHDVLLLCVTCHQLASHHSALLKQLVAAEHDLYDDTSSHKFKEDSHLKQIKSHARVLLKDTAGIPEERLRMLRDSVAGHYQVEGDQLTMETIQAAANIDPRSPNRGYVSHSEVVVATLLAEGGEERLVEFQRRWRQYFLDTMDPKHLPECWSVDHNPARSV